MKNFNDKFKIIIPAQDIDCEPGCLQMLAHGDREAYAWVYNHYGGKVYEYAMMMTNHPQISEDLVQETFVKLWMHRDKLAGVINFNGYLYRMYKNLLLDMLKKQEKETYAKEKYFSDMEKPSTSICELVRKEQKQAVENCVNKLPQQQQLVFRLSREKGLKRGEIATMLKISHFTVKCHLHKALRFLRDGLSV